MSGQIGGIAPGVPTPGTSNHPHGAQSPATGGKSFESIMQQTAGQPTDVLHQGSGTSGLTLEQLRADLMQRLANPNANDFGISFDQARLRISALRDGIHGMAPDRRSPDMLARFSQVENQWMQIEAMLNSDRELSQGELLGLQARMYQLTQNIEILSKVVDQVTGGIKTVLQTNV
ncbi:hypothetical protein [Chloracidobacterium aggregatum]|uniref:Uncharacterized protein n=1 Tax=Chloracidobacterium sp. N TaxID=2821540 RepID=A0ABX8B2D8_9BACT|nr:hypothetical protein [Chloracidobacterium aggregatum]QUV86257.1 hypothetical protein J8C03_15910 [Chloracidobacterium sp. 2]QUV86275.1 hypothetical protein J8C03_11495 [Chloracidobacterium sp. 2]QUV89297.1 hypothetical protein J8C07_16000 [Chloracidobacterium sp. S]QUV92698.1 hypothetical protein J8C04_13205 [Chloracidobacterium sp. A]QUV95173.1 hypothetical protein J8C05_14210 [Chloracidobacterium sp. N]